MIKPGADADREVEDNRECEGRDQDGKVGPRSPPKLDEVVQLAPCERRR